MSRAHSIDAPGREHLDTRRWSAALHKRDKDAHGMVWTSRHSPSPDAMLLFGDRVPPTSLNVVSTTRIDADPVLAMRLRTPAGRSGVTLVV